MFGGVADSELGIFNYGQMDNPTQTRQLTHRKQRDSKPVQYYRLTTKITRNYSLQNANFSITE